MYLREKLLIMVCVMKKKTVINMYLLICATFYLKLIKTKSLDEAPAKWIIKQNYKCLQSPTSSLQHYTSLQQALQHHYPCLLVATLQCVSDLIDYHQSTIRLHYFCGLLDSVNINYVFTALVNNMQVNYVVHTWIITSDLYIRIRFIEFTGQHEGWMCTGERLTVLSRGVADEFCGTRFPWVYDIWSSKANITLFTQHLKLQSGYFKLQYHGSVPMNIGVNAVLKSISPTGHFSDIRHDAESHHFIAESMLHTIEVQVINICKTVSMVCYDGPGTRSPVLHHNHTSLQSTTYQMICVVHNHYSNCAATLTYTTGGQAKVRSLSQNPIEISLRRSAQQYHFYSKKVIVLHQFSCTGFIPYMLIEDQACIFGGVYLYDAAADAKLWSYCNQYILKDKTLHLSSKNAALIVILYPGYVTEDFAITGSIFGQHKGTISLDHEKLFQPYMMNIDSTTYGMIVLQPFLYRQSKSVSTYKIQYKQPEGQNIFFELNVISTENKHQENIKCFFEYAPHYSNMVILFHKETCKVGHKIYASPVKSVIVIDQTSYGQSIWTLTVMNELRTLRDRKGNGSMNYFLPPFADVFNDQIILGHPIIYRLKSPQSPQKSFWFMIQLIFPNNIKPEHIWKILMVDYSYVNEVFVEHISHGEKQEEKTSTVYKWQALNHPQWITGCKICVLTIRGSFQVIQQSKQVVWGLWGDIGVSLKIEPRRLFAAHLKEDSQNRILIAKKDQLRLHKIR